MSKTPVDRQAQDPQMKDFLGNIQSEIIKLKESQTQEMNRMRQEMVSIRQVRQIEHQTPSVNKDQELINMIKAWMARN